MSQCKTNYRMKKKMMMRAAAFNQTRYFQNTGVPKKTLHNFKPV